MPLATDLLKLSIRLLWCLYFTIYISVSLPINSLEPWFKIRYGPFPHDCFLLLLATGATFAQSHARQTLLWQISQEKLDHRNQILLLLVPEKLCSLMGKSKLSHPHICLLGNAKGWHKPGTYFDWSVCIFAVVHETVHVSVQWLSVLFYPLCSSAVLHSQLPDSASKASLRCLRTPAQEPSTSTWQRSQCESWWVYLWMQEDDPWMLRTTFECIGLPLNAWAC